MWYISTVEYYSAIKKNEIMPFAVTWMQSKIIIISDVSQKEKDKYNYLSISLIDKWNIYFTDMWNLKYDINEPIYETDSWT